MRCKKCIRKWSKEVWLPASIDHKKDLHEMVMGPAGSSSLDDVHILASNNFIDNNVRLIIGKPEVRETSKSCESDFY